MEIERIGFKIGNFVYKNRNYIFFIFVVGAFLLGTIGFLFLRVDSEITRIAPEDTFFSEQSKFLSKKLFSNNLIVVLNCDGNVDEGKKALEKLKTRFERTGFVHEVLRFTNPELMIKYGLFSANIKNLSHFIKNYDKLKMELEKNFIDFRFWRNLGKMLYILQDTVEKYINERGFNEYVLESPDKKMLLMSFILKKSIVDVNFVSKCIKEFKKIAEDIEKESGFKIRFTGGAMSTYEANIQVREDFLFTTLFSVVSISFLLFLAYSNFLSVFYLFFSMIVALGISVGIFYFLFGEINIITAFVNAMILGLGIDYGIHTITKIQDHMRKKNNLKYSVEKGLKEVFRPALTSALTTISAFLTMVIGGSKGFVQLGIMIAVGISIFFMTMMLFLPAMMSIIPARRGHNTIFDKLVKGLDFLNNVKIIRHVCITIGVFFSIFGLLNASTYWYTPPGLMQKNSESVKTYQDIKKVFGNVGLGDIVITVKDMEELEKVTKELKKNPLIDKTFSVINILNNVSKDSLNELAGLYGDFIKIVNDPILSTIFRKVGIYKETLEMLEVIKNSNFPEDVLKELEKDVPFLFYDSGNQKYLLIYVNPADDLYVNNNIKKVINSLSKYKLYGYPIVFYKAMESAKDFILKSSLIVFLTIFVLLILDMKSIRIPLISVFFVILSALISLGVAYLNDIRVSFMTLLMVPILVGIGVDSMIHIFHSVKANKEVLLRTEKAIILSILTTIIAF
ncbi:MAG TPA: hypothetical protein EYH25_04585, partial [Thermotoga sp.]|nr:hypothetical protein [Thermotoga sp.]